MNTNDSCETRNSGSAPPASFGPSSSAQPSRPTPESGAPHIGTDIPACDDQPAAWRNAFGSNR